MTSSRLLHAAIVACLLLVGCEYPNEPPLIEQRWIIPVQETTLDVAELLPNGVVEAGSDFQVSVSPVAAGQSLGGLCAACINGGPVPAPAFSGSFQSSQALPTNLISAQLSGGTLRIEIDNGLGFDPIEGGGTLMIELTNGAGGASLGQLQLDGSIDALAPGITVHAVDLVPGALDGPVFATAELTSVGGQAAFIDIGNRIDIRASGILGPLEDISLLISSAVVDVPNQTVTMEPATLEQDIDADITKRILQGTVILQVTNPFGVDLDGSVDIGPTSKSFSVPGTATSSLEISYTGDELRSFLDLPNPTLEGSGSANGAAVTVAPGQVMILEATLDFSIEIG